jgi:hypothetical protein
VVSMIRFSGGLGKQVKDLEGGTEVQINDIR